MSVWNSGLLVLLEWFFLDIQCNSRWYNSMQSLHVALSITRFLEFTATGTGSGWQSDWIQQYFIRIFDATVWILYPLRWTFWTSWYILHGQCILATSQQEGVWKYMDIPGVLWLCLDWNACCILLWNLYPNSWLMCWFVFTKSRLRTRYKSLFLVFSGRLHDAIMSGMMSLTVENIFMENNIFRECVCGRWQWEWCFWKSFGILFCLAWCICSTTTTSKLHFISTGFACQRFEHGWDDFCGERLFFWTGIFATRLEDAFATCANAWVWDVCASPRIWNMILWKWSARCMRSLVQACCTTE